MDIQEKKMNNEMLPIGTTVHINPEDIKWEWNGGDLISRSELKKTIKENACAATYYPTERVLALINNAPAVYDNPYSDGREDGYIEGYEEAKRESDIPQGEFTDLEKKVTADAINYLLGAELLEENGYTEEVINALRSVLQKIGAEENHL